MSGVGHLGGATATQADRAATAFREHHGHAPHGVWSAPGRVNLIGEHTDYNDGFVLPFALPFRCAVAAAPRTDGLLGVTSIGDDGQAHTAPQIAVADLEPGRVTGWAAFPSGVAWALRHHDMRHNGMRHHGTRGGGVPGGGTRGGADLVVAGDVPNGAGLSSSHAFQCAVALALLGLADRSPGTPGGPTLDEIARWVQRSENDFVGAPTGLLDQTASLRCIAAHALFLDVRSGAGEQVPFDAAAHGLEVLVVDTRAKHSLADSAYGDRRAGCERAADLLGLPALRDATAADIDRVPDELRPLVRHVVTENQRVLDTVALLRAGDLAGIGPHLTASHTSLREDYRVSCRELDVAVDAALAAGALGARMTGGGFGGSAIALVPLDQGDAVRSAVRRAYAEHSLPEPRQFTATPSAGAGRDR